MLFMQEVNVFFLVLWGKSSNVFVAYTADSHTLLVSLLGSESDLLLLLPSVHLFAFNASSLFPHVFKVKISSVFTMVKIPLRFWIETEFKVVR